MKLLRALGTATLPLAVAAIAGATVLVPDARIAPDAELERWQEYSSDAGRFRVLLPELPRVSHSMGSSIGGPVPGARYAVQIGDTRLQLEHHDMPRLATLVLSPQSLLSRAADGLLEDEQAREIERAPIEWQGYPGVALYYEIPGSEAVITRGILVLVERRLYMVLAAWPAGSDSRPRPEVARVLGSFVIQHP